MSESDLWQGVLYLHLLAMALFVGGQLVFGIAVVTILRGDPDRERMRSVARRFGYGSLVASSSASHCCSGDPARVPGDRLAGARAGHLALGRVCSTRLD